MKSTMKILLFDLYRLKNFFLILQTLTFLNEALPFCFQIINGSFIVSDFAQQFPIDSFFTQVLMN